MATYIFIGAAALFLVATVLLLRELKRLSSAVADNTAETRELRLTARTRVRTASVQSGPVTQEQSLVRLGRASAARRVIVGGDDDSQQKQDLQKQYTPRGEDDNERS